MVTGLAALLTGGPKIIILEILGQPINIVPLLWAVDGSWFGALFCAYLAMHGRLGRVVQGLAERFETFFLVAVPFEMAYIVGFVTLALSNTWVWNHFVSLLLVGIFSIYFASTLRDWHAVLRLDYLALRRLYQLLRRVVELIRIRRKIHRIG